jgi:hypothetical protein
VNLRAVAHVPALPGNVTPDNLRSLREDSAAREALLRRIISGFEQKYGCPLETFEEQLTNRQAPEHPGWEDSIEWRNAVEELERARVSRSIFAWLDNLLAQSAAS